MSKQELNNSNSKNFSNHENKIKSAVKLFEETSVFKSLLKIVFMAIIVSLATGIYVFADQILIVQVLPTNHFFSQENIFSNNEFNFLEIQNLINTKPLLFKPSLDVSSLIRTSISLSSPLLMVCTAISLMLGLGTSITFSKELGKKNFEKVKKIWNNGVYNTLFISLGSSALIMLIGNFVIELQSTNTNVNQLIGEQNLNNWTELEISKLQSFLDFSRTTSIEWAKQYMFILVGMNVFNNFITLFISLLNSEGKNVIPTSFILAANILNIGLDYLLLYFTNLGIAAAAIATVISWVISVMIFVSYVYYENRRQATMLEFKSLKKISFDKKILGLIFLIGLASLFRNTSVATYSLTQQSLYGNITQQITGFQQEYYLNILGAVNPIYNLFFSTIIGVIRGARTVVTYNYARNQVKNVQKAYIICFGMATIYALIFFIFSSFIIQQPLLWLFNITPSIDPIRYAESVKILRIVMGQLPLFGFTISGMLFFQSTAKIFNSIITSIMYGTIIGIPGLFIASELAKANNNIDIFNFAPLIIISVSGLIIFGYSTWYVFKKYPKEVKNNIN